MIGVILLAVLCIGLGVALFTTKKQAAEEKQKDTATISTLSNQWVKTDRDLGEQRQVNVMLSNDLTVARSEFSGLTNKFTDVASTLVKTEGSLKLSQAEVVARDKKIAELDQRNHELEQQNHDLDLRAADLSTALTNLTALITDTKGKLARSEGDKAFLEKELKRLMVEKAELERQFNDLSVVRAQVAKLREELNVSRRLEWIRKGLFATDDQKGAQKLMQRAPLAPAASTNRYDLNVEVNADGSVRVIPPLTNAPAAPK